MAFGWMTALKIIPWGSVLESAPHIVKAAKQLFSAVKTDTSGFSADQSSSAYDGTASPENLNKRTRLIEAKIAELSDEQKSTAELIKSLAEQNALIVDAIDVFRVRVRIVLIACILLIAVLCSLIFWLAMNK
jgi:glycerol-3-phosphate dehydrogenase